MSIRRVLVLARAGAARERTEAALRQAGAELVAVLDPVVAEPEQVRAQAPDAVLVVLDPAVDPMLWLGLNMVRIHIKAEDPRKLYWLDKAGILVMADIPCFWGEPSAWGRRLWSIWRWPGCCTTSARFTFRRTLRNQGPHCRQATGGSMKSM